MHRAVSRVANLLACTLCREKRPNFVSAQIKAKCVVPDVLGYIWSALCKNIQLKVAHTRRHKVYISQSPAVVTYNTALAWVRPQVYGDVCTHEDATPGLCNKREMNFQAEQLYHLRRRYFVRLSWIARTCRSQ